MPPVAVFLAAKLKRRHRDDVALMRRKDVESFSRPARDIPWGREAGDPALELGLLFGASSKASKIFF
jgi:hypothetical protein